MANGTVNSGIDSTINRRAVHHHDVTMTVISHDSTAMMDETSMVKNAVETVFNYTVITGVSTVLFMGLNGLRIHPAILFVRTICTVFSRLSTGGWFSVVACTIRYGFSR